MTKRLNAFISHFLKLHVFLLSFLIGAHVVAEEQSSQPPILAIYVDGPDGAGKSSVVEFIAKHYTCIKPIHILESGLMPTKRKERLAWYQNEDAFLTAIPYLAAHRKRFESLSDYKGKLHYKQNTGKSFFSIIVWDRGPLSAKAYAFASIKLNTGIPAELIAQFVKQHFTYIPPDHGVASIELYAKSEDAPKFLARAGDVVDQERELKLIEGQLEYYESFHEKPTYPTLKLDPFNDLEANLKMVDKFLKSILGSYKWDEISLNKQTKTKGRLLLSSVLKEILAYSRSGRITLVGDIVKYGYTDDFIEVIFENDTDKKGFPLKKNLRIIDSKEFDETCTHLIIDTSSGVPHLKKR